MTYTPTVEERLDELLTIERFEPPADFARTILRDVHDGADVGDTSTLADAAVVTDIQERVAGI